MSVRSVQPLSREHRLLLATLLLLAAVAWALLLWQSAHTAAMAPALTMGFGLPLFLAIWVVMMVAMMFPTAAPMILMFARIHAGKREQGHSFVSTWVFVAAYLVIWTVFGVMAYLLASGAQRLAAESPALTHAAPRLGGAVLILAGLYQLSPLKTRCLSACRSPLAFVLGSWREGELGSFRMGIEHGISCLGCCWLLFVILFPLGMMNIAAMATLTGLIFAEKSLALGPRLVVVAAVLLIGYGALVVVTPGALPAMG